MSKNNGTIKQSYFENLAEDDKKKLTEIATEVKTALINMKKKRYAIGELLDTAKAILPHGYFKKWIEQTFGDSLAYATGYFYMRCYRTFTDDRKVFEKIPQQYLHIMTENDFPRNVLTYLTSTITDKGFPKGKWEDITRFYEMFKDKDHTCIDEEGFLWLVKKVIQDEEERLKASSNGNDHFYKFLNAMDYRESMYKEVHNALKRFERLMRKANRKAWDFPFNPEDKLHQSVTKRIDGNIKELEKLARKLKRLKNALNGGEGLFSPVSTPTGTEYLNDPNLGLNDTDWDAEWEEIWDNEDEDTEEPEPVLIQSSIK